MVGPKNPGRSHVRAAVDGREQAAEAFGVGVLDHLEHPVQLDFHVVAPAHLGGDTAPPRLDGHDEGARGAVLVGVLQDAGVAGVVAARLRDERLQLGAARLEAQRQEAQEYDGQDVPLVVRRLDGAAELDGGLPQLLGDVDEAAVGLRSWYGLPRCCSLEPAFGLSPAGREGAGRSGGLSPPIRAGGPAFAFQRGRVDDAEAEVTLFGADVDPVPGTRERRRERHAQAQDDGVAALAELEAVVDAAAAGVGACEVVGTEGCGLRRSAAEVGSNLLPDGARAADGHRGRDCDAGEGAEDENEEL